MDSTIIYTIIYGIYVVYVAADLSSVTHFWAGG